jgi:hypothetical protein
MVLPVEMAYHWMVQVLLSQFVDTLLSLYAYLLIQVPGRTPNAVRITESERKRTTLSPGTFSVLPRLRGTGDQKMRPQFVDLAVCSAATPVSDT